MTGDRNGMTIEMDKNGVYERVRIVWALFHEICNFRHVLF
jgi:hypothetical protein